MYGRDRGDEELSPTTVKNVAGRGFKAGVFPLCTGHVVGIQAETTFGHTFSRSEPGFHSDDEKGEPLARPRESCYK